MNDFNDIHDGHEDFGPPPQDEFDSLLRDWHNENADRAAAGRDRLLQSLAVSQKNHDSSSNQATSDRALGRFPLRRIIMNRYSPAAAAMLLIGTLVAILNYAIPERAKADIIMLPEGGRLDALSPGGYVLGPCPLKHTDVDVDISGDFARVTLTQRFHNPYEDKIEAVYTFPMSHRAAVDRMTMTIGERVIIGEVHERQRARAIYEAAKQRGHVASLLEQERPNIFTQSVANIEPGTDMLIEISYVELLERHDGESSFNFPMVVGPRYVPGAPERNTYRPPHGLKERFGLILLAPAELTLGQAGDSATLGELDNEQLRRLIDTAIPIEQPAMNGSANAGGEEERQVWYGFEVLYPGVSQEFGVLYSDQTGQIAGRWFYFQLVPQPPTGTGFAPDTNQVPDASRITPIPTKPPTRAGHDISLTVHIDTGGPGIVDLQSALHEVAISGQRFGGDGLPQAETIELAGSTEIPNRDFILTWRQAADTITESILTHTGEHGNFFTLILQPPERVKDAQAVPRELIFVLDTSGSMSGFPIDKAKECMAKAMDGLRDNDTFNLITFAGDTHILWDEPRPGTWENIAEAQNFLASREGSGGTEMMTAINAALVRTWSGPITPRRLADLPADGRDVQVVLSPTKIETRTDAETGIEETTITVRAGLSVHTEDLPPLDWTDDYDVLAEGRWDTIDGCRVFSVARYKAVEPQPEPVRIVCFMTDGYIGNDMDIIDAIQKNADTTRVFSFGIGNSVNRYLLDNMVQAGRGAAEFVPLNDDADEVAARFLERIQTPVLTDIELEFSEGLDVLDMLPEQVPDLHDRAPIIVHGRYGRPGSGTLTIRGNAGDGPYERVLDLELPESQPMHDTIATLWARAKVEEIMSRDLAAAQNGSFPPELRRQVVELGEQFGIMTQYTSFVAVEKLRLTLGGQPRLVGVPVELPDGVSYEGAWGRHLCGWVQRVSCMKTAPRNATGGGRFLLSHGSGGRGGLGGNHTETSRMVESPGVRTGELHYGQPGLQPMRTKSDACLIPGGAPAGGSVDAWSVVRANDTVPKQLVCLSAPQETGAVQGLSSSDFQDATSLSYAYQYQHDANRRVVGTSSDPTFPVLADGNPYVKGSEGVSQLNALGYLDSGSGTSVRWNIVGHANGESRDCLVPLDVRTPPATDSDSDAVQDILQYAFETRDYYVRRPTGSNGSILCCVRDEEVERMMAALKELDSASRGQAATSQPVGDDGRAPSGPTTPPSDIEMTERTIAEALQRPWLEGPEYTFDGVSLETAFDQLGRQGTVKIVVNWSALKSVGIEKDAKVTLKAVPPVSRATMLDRIVELYASQDKQIGYGIFGKVVYVSTERDIAFRKLLDTCAEFGCIVNLSTMLPEQVVIHAAALHEASQADEARRLIDALLAFTPDHKAAAALRDALADKTLDDEARKERVAEIRKEAAAAIDALAERIRTLAKRVDERLLAQIMGGEPGPGDGDETHDGRVTISVLTTNKDAATLLALKDAGLVIEGKAASANVVVGRAPLTSVEGIALLEGISRIEPVNESD